MREAAAVCLLECATKLSDFRTTEMANTPLNFPVNIPDLFKEAANSAEMAGRIMALQTSPRRAQEPADKSDLSSRIADLSASFAQ